MWINLNFFLNLGPISMDKVHYCERFIELMLDLEVSFLINSASSQVYFSRV